MKINFRGISIIAAMLFSLASTAQSRPTMNSLVLYLPLGAKAQAKDASGYKNNGTVAAVVVPHSPALVSMQQTRQLTIAVWIKPTAIRPGFPEIVSKGGNEYPGAFGGYELLLNSAGDNDLVFESAGTGGVCELLTHNANGSLINNHLGEWIHVAFTIDDRTKTVMFYVNGIPTNDVGDSGSYFNKNNTLNFDVPNDLYIGIPDPASDADRSNFEGSLRDLMIFNRALSASEIQEIFKSNPLARNFNAI